MHRLAQFLLKHLRANELLRAGDHLGVAVSGGADSVALLMLLLELRSDLGVVLSVAHFNHKLRGTESDEDEQFVRELALRHDLPFVSESGDVKGHAAEKKLSLETAARELRYAFFHRAMITAPLDKIATAHTLDDQAETVVLKLVRGAGTRGLAGIYPRVSAQALTSGERWIVRPLLAGRRREIEGYLRDREQVWREDSSNLELRHTRNRIRHEILPRLEQLNPRLSEVLAETAEVARAEEEYWERQVALLMPQAWKVNPRGGSLDRNSLRAQPVAAQRRLVRAAARSLGLNLEFQHVKGILDLDCEGARLDLPEGRQATLRKDLIVISNKARTSHPYEYPLPVPARVKVPEAGVTIETEIAEAGTEPLLDCSFAGKNLIVRNWHASERFWPAHSKAPKKIKELLQDRHINGDLKGLWPVVASGNEVLWIHGMGVRRDLKAEEGSGILIRAVPLGS